MKATWPFYVLAPVVGAAVLVGLWSAVMAAQEKIRVARSTSQILSVVAIVRDMAPNAATDGPQATASLLKHLTSLKSIKIATDEKNTALGVLNPWDQITNLSVEPSAQQLRFTMLLPPHSCRHVLRFFAKDARVLGLTNVETRRDKAEPWLPTYAERPNENLTSEAIKIGCGKDKLADLALVFRLKKGPAE